MMFSGTTLLKRIAKKIPNTDWRESIGNYLKETSLSTLAKEID
jgi:hypothetical protein